MVKKWEIHFAIPAEAGMIGAHASPAGKPCQVGFPLGAQSICLPFLILGVCLLHCSVTKLIRRLESIEMSAKLRLIIQLSAGLLSLSLLACQQQNPEEPHQAPVPPSDEVVLGPESPKRQYIQETVAEWVQRPLMDPVTGKITYDEIHTARVSSPIAGRVVGAI